MKKIATYLSSSLAIASMPLVALAATTPQVTLNKNTITTLLTSFRDWAAGIIFILGVLIMLYAAFLYMTAGGDEEKVGKAKSTLIYGLVGIGIAIIAFGIFGLISSFLS